MQKNCTCKQNFFFVNQAKQRFHQVADIQTMQILGRQLVHCNGSGVICIKLLFFSNVNVNEWPFINPPSACTYTPLVWTESLHI